MFLAIFDEKNCIIERWFSSFFGIRFQNGAKECIVYISARAFQRVFTCKNRRRYSRERAPRSLGGKFNSIFTSLLRCDAYCSKHGYCGTANVYKSGGTDCSACKETGYVLMANDKKCPYVGGSRIQKLEGKDVTSCGDACRLESACVGFSVKTVPGEFQGRGERPQAERSC